MPKTLTIRHIVRTVNLTHLVLPSNYEAKNTTVRKYVDIGKVSDSPKKRELPPITPYALLEERNLYVTGMQDYGDIGK